jgi:hypothetical protein
MRNPQVIIAKEKPLVAMETWKARFATLRADLGGDTSLYFV